MNMCLLFCQVVLERVRVFGVVDAHIQHRGHRPDHRRVSMEASVMLLAPFLKV